MTKEKKLSTRTLVMSAVLTALVIVLQYMGAFVKLGTFSISLVLIPIVIGTATCGAKIGAFLGTVFGIVVLLSGDATPFLTVNAPGTIITVLVKGCLCGLISGYAYSLINKLSRGNIILSTAVAAVVCPLVNTGVFLLGCLVFFMDTISMWATEAGLGGNVAQYMIIGLVGGNFIFELAVNIIFAPVIVRILRASERI